VAAIAVVLDHTTAGALYDPKDPFNEAAAAFYVQASGGLGDLYAPVLSLTAGDAERPGLLGYIKDCGSSGSRPSTPTLQSPSPSSCASDTPGPPSTPSTPPAPPPRTPAGATCSA
jgi:hypothetical protein